MLWLQRPPYLRYLAGGLIVALAVFVELRPTPTVEHPFALRDLSPGEAVDDQDVDWRQVPQGLLRPVALPGVLSQPVAAGEPLTPTALSQDPPTAPEGWWVVEVPLPLAARRGQEVRLVLTPVLPGDPPATVPGVVVMPATPDDGLSGPAPGLVAVPPDWVEATAAAVAELRVTVALAGG